jgi:hypothetical protein
VTPAGALATEFLEDLPKISIRFPKNALAALGMVVV